jgi:hypothetical protein
MKRVQLAIILLSLMAMIGCTAQPTVTEEELTPTATATLPDPQVFITRAPEVGSIIDRFMDAWRRDDYAGMYALISAPARQTISEEAFTTRYSDTAIALTLLFDDGITYQILSQETNPNQAMARLSVNYNTNFFGTLNRELEMTFVREAGEWRLEWHEGLIMP